MTLTMNEPASTPPGRVTTYHATIDLVRPADLGVLSGPERVRAAGYAKVADHNRFVVGAVLVRAVAGERLGSLPRDVVVDRRCAHCQKSHGRPSVRGFGPAISVSHSGRHVIVAINEAGPVGADIETVSDQSADHTRLDWLVLNPDEVVPRDQREFLTTWTRKEALLKLTGEGLLLAPSLLRLSAPNEPAKVLAAPAVLDDAAVADLHLAEDAAAALAVYGRFAGIEVIDASCYLS